MTHILGWREGGRREGARATGQGPGQRGLSPSRGCGEPPSPLPCVPRSVPARGLGSHVRTAGSRADLRRGLFSGAQFSENMPWPRARAVVRTMAGTVNMLWGTLAGLGGPACHLALTWFPGLGLGGTFTPAWGAGTHMGPRVGLRRRCVHPPCAFLPCVHVCVCGRQARRAGGPGTRMGHGRRGAWWPGHTARLWVGSLRGLCT